MVDVLDYLPIIASALIVYFTLGIAILGLKTYHAVYYSLNFMPKMPEYNLIRKRVLITGANAGIGQALTKQFLAAGAHVTVLVRSKQSPTKLWGKNVTSRNLAVVYIDLGDLSTFEAACDQLQAPFDLVVLNAGMTVHPPQTCHGLDKMMFINFWSNVFLYRQLVKRKLFAINSRLVFTSSDTHRWQQYKALQVTYEYTLMNQALHYAYTKMYNQMFVNYLALNAQHASKINVGEPANITSACPGPVFTSIARNAPWHMRIWATMFMGVLFQSCDRGAKHIFYACVMPMQEHAAPVYRWMMYPRPLSQSTLNAKNLEEFMHDVDSIVKPLEAKHQL